jgi:SRSO17 transposase
LAELKIEYAVGIPSNHGVWMKEEEEVSTTQWQEFTHIIAENQRETRYIREIIYGKRRVKQYWQITIDKETLPGDGTWFVMTKIGGLTAEEVGNIYKIRMQIE